MSNFLKMERNTLVLGLVRDGMSQKEIAEHLGRTKSTVSGIVDRHAPHLQRQLTGRRPMRSPKFTRVSHILGEGDPAFWMKPDPPEPYHPLRDNPSPWMQALTSRPHNEREAA